MRGGLKLSLFFLIKKATPCGIAFGSVVKDAYFPTRGYLALWLCAYALRAALLP